MGEKLVLLDGYSLMYRAFFAVQGVMTAPDGTPTNAAHNFMMMLTKLIDEEKPDALAAAFDLHAPTFRHRLYDAYKGTRKPMPDELRAQDPIIRELLGAMGIPIIEREGYEADDIMGTLSLQCEDSGDEALLVTGDRDSFQLAGPRTTILYTKKGITDTVRVTPEYIMETYGVKPEQLIDVKALMGDTSDNIPGIPGIGEKTALKLIQQFGSLQGALDSASAQKGKLKERLETGRASAELSYTLAKIDRHAPVEAALQDWHIGDITGALPRLRSLSMNAAIRRVTETAKRLPSAPASAKAMDAESEKLPKIETFDALEPLKARIAELAKGAKWASLHLGQSLTVATDAARLSLALGGDLLSTGITDAEALEAALPLMRLDCPKALHDIKSLPMDLDDIRGDIIDVMLAAYALNPQRPGFDAESLCGEAGVDGYALHPATALRRLAERQREQLTQTGVEKVYREIELPLAYVLRAMERAGMLVDADVLSELGQDFRAHIAALTDEIADMAGARINLNSPKQLGELLFTKLGIPSPTKKISTKAEVLEGLADDYPICAKILEYRKYQKLQSTYIDALIPMRDDEGRVHTRFDPVGTATGRISSSEPNLQNIPVRTELGKAIRGAFIAAPGCVLVDADYSQIELRVLAHMSGDPTMIHAFNEGQDIHARTASEVYGVPLEQVTPQMRSACKAVNFGIVYGISEFTLAKNIGTSRWEAKAFIERYFARYPGVKTYMDESVKRGYAQGYVTTLMGRRRYLPELQSGNYSLRSFGERCAMNSPIQGTAADIIKLAMIRVYDALKRGGFQARLIMQVHDELIIEAPEAEAARVAELLRDCMENVCALAVPLKTDISTGGDWRACK